MRRETSAIPSVREQAIRACRALLNGSGKLGYFEQRGITAGTLKRAGVGYDAGAFTYPCIRKSGGLLAIHCKSEARDAKGKRRQWWKGYADDLPSKGHGRWPDEPAKVIPFGLETLRDLEPRSLVILCCGEEDALSLRQIGYTALSQPGAGLLEPVYAREFAELEVVIFYDAGEEQEARKDGLKLLEAGARSVRIVGWPPDDPYGSDVNGRLVENARGFEGWAAGMISDAKSASTTHTPAGVEIRNRNGEPDVYTPYVPEPAELRWPTLAEEAYCGLPGEIVRAIEPHTEADPVAVLMNLLCAFGNAIGRGAHMRVEGDIHYLKLYAGLVGETSKGRKGTSWSRVREMMRSVEPEWSDNRVLTGLSSGEGLIYHVRDRVDGENKNGEPIVLDPGVKDKRLLIVEPELARVLKVMCRDGNTLSADLRQAWDGDRLQTLTKNSPLKSTGAHVAVIGHITKAELLRHLTETEAANGFANRFIWLMVRRSKQLPHGGEWHKVDAAPLIRRLSSALEFGKRPMEIGWTDGASQAWCEVYGPLSEGKPGLFGAVVGRSEAQALRLAALYAAINESRRIELDHLEAALAVWDYAEESARYTFGDATGDPVADQILEALRAAGKNGMSRTDISHLFKRHRSAERIGQALTLLLKTGRAQRRLDKDTGGRPSERWFAK
jgi:hypothetical protein